MKAFFSFKSLIIKDLKELFIEFVMAVRANCFHFNPLTNMLDMSWCPTIGTVENFIPILYVKLTYHTFHSFIAADRTSYKVGRKFGTTLKTLDDADRL